MRKIMVIDDEVIVLEMIQAILEMEGYQVLLACNGLEGLQACRNDPEISLVITDIVMPDVEGLETIHELRKINPKVKIIAVSGVSHKDAYLKMAKSLGADAVLSKPFSADELVLTVASCFGSQ